MLYAPPPSLQCAPLTTITETEGITQDYIIQTYTEASSANPPGESKTDRESLKTVTNVESFKPIENTLNNLPSGTSTEVSKEALLESSSFDELEKETLQCLEEVEAAFQERHEKYEEALYLKAMGTMSCPI
ncbi:hypothetical protein C7M61_002720 [Candidozyma pseudohaemuli]|uniref:Uncharacterized protein n=1 Tax=Candidozyma pseudohaemuli TaxID=418784 RepID=A0A2P7YQA5_9ASCO|nr:hypothetical protein C7M61_002720 [[Candida] pseudohaemulonii]PSK38168.1 hypothetical protein C7M61_002720 [[Candida] pseudohaemulonii]